MVSDQATAPNPNNHDGDPDQQGLADPNLLHQPWNTGHHDGFQEDFHGVQNPVHLLAEGLGSEELGEELWEHLLVKDGVERPGEDDVDDDCQRAFILKTPKISLREAVELSLAFSTLFS